MASTFFVYNAPSESLIVNFANALSRNDQPLIDKIIHELIAVSFRFKFSCGDLWQNYLTHFILTNENIFSLSCERRTPPENSLRDLALKDFSLCMKLFSLNHESMKILRDFRGNDSDESSPVYEMSKMLASAKSPQEFYEHVTNFYEKNGVGAFAFHKAFRLEGERLSAVEHVGNFRLDDLVGYEAQKRELISNTEAFICGRPANNVLLYGDGGTGKSTSIKAILNEYYSRGLRVVEIYKHQFKNILQVSEALRKRNYKFIIFIDDLSFEENESEYKYLKAIIEGGIETRPENILIYATSNRRHIVREIWKDRDDMEHNGDIHRSDTVEEKLSLASRFGIAINYSSPSREDYHEIVVTLAKKAGINIPESELLAGADRWEIRHGGKTGRAARQYVDYLLGRE